MFRKIGVTADSALHPPQLTWRCTANNASYNYPMSSEQHLLAGFGQSHKLRQVVFDFLNTCSLHETSPDFLATQSCRRLIRLSEKQKNPRRSEGSSSVEMNGIEPSTSCLQSRRSTN